MQIGSILGMLGVQFNPEEIMTWAMLKALGNLVKSVALSAKAVLGSPRDA